MIKGVFKRDPLDESKDLDLYYTRKGTRGPTIKVGEMHDGKVWLLDDAHPDAIAGYIIEGTATIVPGGVFPSELLKGMKDGTKA